MGTGKSKHGPPGERGKVMHYCNMQLDSAAWWRNGKTVKNLRRMISWWTRHNSWNTVAWVTIPPAIVTSSFLVLSDKLDVAFNFLHSSVHASHQVSLKLQDSNKTGSLSFLVQSDKLDFVFTFLSLPFLQRWSQVFAYLLVIEVGRYAFCRVVSWVCHWLECYSQLFQTNFLQVVLVINYRVLRFDQIPVELDLFGLIICGGVEIRGAAILSWISVGHKWIVAQQTWTRWGRWQQQKWSGGKGLWGCTLCSVHQRMTHVVKMEWSVFEVYNSLRLEPRTSCDAW